MAAPYLARPPAALLESEIGIERVKNGILKKTMKNNRAKSLKTSINSLSAK